MGSDYCVLGASEVGMDAGFTETDLLCDKKGRRGAKKSRRVFDWERNDEL